MNKEKVKSSKPLYVRIKYLEILTILLSLLALSYILYLTLPSKLDFPFFFTKFVDKFHLHFLIKYLPYFGLITFVILLFLKKRVYYLLIVSTITALFNQYTPIVTAINERFHTNIARSPHALHLTPLYFAVKSNNYDEVKLLLDNGANPNEKLFDKYESLIIFIAIKNKNYNMAKLILDYNANLGLYDKAVGYPIHEAVKNEDYEMVKLLIDYKSPINVKTSFHKARITNFMKTTYPSDYGEKTPLHYAVIKNNHKIAKLLIENGANINITDSGKNTPIQYTKDNDMTTLLKK